MREAGELRRVLGLGECVFFGVGVILGAGVYAVVGAAAAFSGPMLWASFLAASLLALLTALSYAELVALYPAAGGEYVYAREALGPRIALLLGVLIATSGALSGATIAVGFAGYFRELAGVAPGWPALAVIGALAIVHALGIRGSSITNIVMTLIEVLGLVFVVIAAAPTIGAVDLLTPPAAGAHGLATAAALAFFAFIGFEDLIKLAEEAREPAKTMPRALLLTWAIVTAIYLVVAIAAVSAVPAAELGEGGSPLARVVAGRFGRAGALAIAVVALFSCANSILSNMIGSSRLLRGIGRDHRRVRALARVSRRRIPWVALCVVAGAMAGLSRIGELATIALIGNFFILATFALVHVCVLVLRRRRPAAARAFRVPGSVAGVPVLPALALALIAAMLAYSVRGLVIAP